MKRSFRPWALAAALLLVAAPASGQAGARCIPGYVARLALPGDFVCVLPDSRARIRGENARASLLWTPGVFGPQTCASGYVWRNAVADDNICVTPDIRSLVREENNLADAHRLP